jgi:hypothetical protein
MVGEVGERAGEKQTDRQRERERERGMTYKKIIGLLQEKKIIIK